jgi:hypothetical protein
MDASYGVTTVDGEYVLATTDSYLDPQVYLYTAPAPAGPFTGARKSTRLRRPARACRRTTSPPIPG